MTPVAPESRLPTAGRLRVRYMRRRRPAVDNRVSGQLITYTAENFVQWVRRAFKDGRFSELKTRRSRREIDMSVHLISELKVQKLRCPLSADDLVFQNHLDRPEARGNVLVYGWRPAPRRAGLAQRRFHALRHTYASLQLAHGTPVTYISEQLGHSSPAITLSVHAHAILRFMRGWLIGSMS